MPSCYKLLLDTKGISDNYRGTKLCMLVSSCNRNIPVMCSAMQTTPETLINTSKINATFVKRAIDPFMSHFEGKLLCCYNIQTVQLVDYFSEVKEVFWLFPPKSCEVVLGFFMSSGDRTKVDLSAVHFTLNYFIGPWTQTSKTEYVVTTETQHEKHLAYLVL